MRGFVALIVAAALGATQARPLAPPDDPAGPPSTDAHGRTSSSVQDDGGDGPGGSALKPRAPSDAPAPRLDPPATSTSGGAPADDRVDAGVTAADGSPPAAEGAIAVSPSAEPAEDPPSTDGRRARRRHGRGHRDTIQSGSLELFLGSVALAASAALIANGAWQLEVGRRKAAICPEADECLVDPPGVRYAAAGLSFGLAIPVAIGGAFLLRKGTRLLREERRLRVDPSLSPRAAGATLTLRF